MKLMTYNIRYDNPGDGDWGWPQRRAAVCATITRQAPDVLAVQEVLAGPLATLTEALAGYQFVGVARDDGCAAGEYNGLFYRPSQFALIAQGHQWLSRTPDAPSRFPGAGSHRVFQWARLRERATGQVSTVVATHLDDRSQAAREQGVAQILRYFASLLATGDRLLVAGDFNSTPADHAYHTAAAVLHDAALSVPAAPGGPVGTFRANGLFTADTALASKRIDYWFTSPAVTVTSYAVDATPAPDGRYPSDHLPVVITVA